MSDKSGGGDIVRYICVDMLRSIHINVSFVQNFYFLQAQYPKCLAKCFVLIMSWFFVGAWRIISSFLGKGTTLAHDCKHQLAILDIYCVCIIYAYSVANCYCLYTEKGILLFGYECFPFQLLLCFSCSFLSVLFIVRKLFLL